MKNIEKPYNGKCQTNNCKGTFKQVKNYTYTETEPNGKQPWNVKVKCEHTITAYQCQSCGRIHGEVELTTGETIKFYEGSYNNSFDISFQTPSEFGTKEKELV